MSYKADTEKDVKHLGSETLLLDNQLCFALYSASLTMTKIYKPLLQSLGVTYPQYLVMLTLWERDEITVSEVGERLYLDSGTLTPLLKRLELSGLVRRQRSVKDERQVIVSLTDQGNALRQDARLIPQQVSCSAQCSLDELRALTGQLQRLRAAMANNV
ncbi:MarR family transcriptional regulator [Glaciimonas sp. Gout2]|uniref:MarR family winged helix-turn-helix transcriptional regulator n=1 Tax=Glaciimonas sp. Cout2 TaxID=3048621 RepID=UPI002B234586|nr:MULTISPECIES: MarR family transcriptional regulator [unclassified Glaciimonas]MEB0012336.1 MarR family transcriptional regulator [Glaciimonas sp. Cout2]MEB0080478.1 MarR family transcriptional regulator [Glaciimonas sp. Gout2]